jgi:hypothetical protein
MWKTYNLRAEKTDYTDQRRKFIATANGKTNLNIALEKSSVK